MALTWRGRRQLIYYVVGGVIGLGIAIAAYQAFFAAGASCRNGELDDNEKGVDCGGACTLVCKQDARAPVVLWARSFESSPGRYSAAAYVQNGNAGAGARRVGYTFQLFDEKNELVVEKRGVADLPPVQAIPLVETGIDTGTRSVARTLFSFTGEPEWHAQRSPLPALRTTNQRLEAGSARLTATLVNESSIPAPRAQVVAILFDRNGVALGASKSVVSVGARSQEFVVFTWAPAPAGVARAEIIILPPF